MTDEELLSLVGNERKRAIGFGETDSGELVGARERALRYYRGDVTRDIPSLVGRSQAVSTDVAEAIETVLPDVMEIFIGGDDVATFTPLGEEDEDQAREESEFVRHVIFTENPGFLVFNTAFKDALLVRTGLFHWRWEDEESEEAEDYGPMDEETLGVLAQQVPGIETRANEDGSFGASLTKRKLHGKVCVEAWPPEDFSVAADTITLRDATYACARSRPRVQDLIVRGVDAEVARNLPSYSHPDQQVELARDMAGENDSRSNDTNGDLRQVEVHSHYIRLEEGGELVYWRVDTNSEETTLIDKEQVSCIPFGAITPYINSHRFYGESVADKLIEIQKIKTTLLRMFLDDGYFALNQRMQVDMTFANEFTISDLLRNEPNMPVRTKGNALSPLRAGGLNFDALAALEYASVMSEQRTGIVRNAQGLNPDSLHETAKGAMALISAAQKRVRYIARIFAETGVKDLIRGVHDLLRSGYGAETEEGVERANPTAKLGKGWKQVEPGSWKERCDIDVQIGIGSAGREQDLMVMQQVMEIQQQMAMGGLGGIIVKPDNIYNAAKRFAQAGNIKTPELYFSDPAEAEPQPPKPDPEMAKVEGQMQLEQQKAMGQFQLEQAKTEAKTQSDAQAAQQDYDLSMMKMQGEMELKRYQIDQELQLKREQLVAELQLKRELGMAQAEVQHSIGQAKVSASTSTVEPGGDPG